MPVSQDSSFINDYSKVKEQVIMVIEYLQQIKDSYFEQKHALEKQLNLLEIQLKENTGMIKMLEEQMIRAMNCLHLEMLIQRIKLKLMN